MEGLMTKKFILGLAICLWMLIGTNAWADLVNGDYTYTEYGSEVTITGYNGFGGDVVIPDIIDDMPVVSIGVDAFYVCSALTSVTIPDSVTSIGIRAFYWCAGLTSVTFGNSVKSIGQQAFYRCESLASLNLPDSLTSISLGAFQHCNSLTSLNIPDSVTNIYTSAFRECENLANVTIGNGLSYIGQYVFAYCTSLTSITFGYSFTNTSYSSFLGCTSLESITIPDTVTYMGVESFKGCTSLSVVYFLGDEPSMSARVFDECAPDFRICYTLGATGFTTPIWVTNQGEIFSAGICCTDNTDCAEGEVCVEGACVEIVCIENWECPDGFGCADDVCVEENPPVIGAGPFLAAGSWPVLSTKVTLTENSTVLWTFDDDYATCEDEGLCTHRARYKRVGDTKWYYLKVETDSEGKWYAYTELPVDRMVDGTYYFQFDLFDCAGQLTQSRTYYFKVAHP